MPGAVDTFRLKTWFSFDIYSTILSGELCYECSEVVTTWCIHLSQNKFFLSRHGRRTMSPELVGWLVGWLVDAFSQCVANESDIPNATVD
jgi:hypothetical protein